MRRRMRNLNAQPAAGDVEQVPRMRLYRPSPSRAAWKILPAGSLMPFR